MIFLDDYKLCSHYNALLPSAISRMRWGLDSMKICRSMYEASICTAVTQLSGLNPQFSHLSFHKWIHTLSTVDQISLALFWLHASQFRSNETHFCKDEKRLNEVNCFWFHNIKLAHPQRTKLCCGFELVHHHLFTCVYSCFLPVCMRKSRPFLY